MSESRTSNVIKNSFANILLRFVEIICQFLLRTAFIYLLGNEYTGVAGLFTDILQVLSLMELGLDVSMVYSLYKPLVDKDVKRISALMNFYKKAFTIIGVVIFGIGTACIPMLDYIVKDVPNITEDIRVIFEFYVLTSAASYFFIYKTILLKADQKARIVSKWSGVIRFIETVLEIIALLVVRDFYAYLILHFVSVVVTNFILSRITTKMYSEFFKDKSAKLSKHETFVLFRNIACLLAYDMSGVIINSTDSIFISAFVGTTQVAIIGNYTLIINSIRTAVAMGINASRPSIGNLAVTSSPDKQRDVFKKINFISFSITCVCATCLFVLLTPFISDVWFSANYAIPQNMVAILCVNFFIACMVLPVESFRTANGLFVDGWIRPLCTAALNIVFNFILGSRYGIMGIFFATTISRVGTQVWYDAYLIYKKVFKSKVREYYLDLAAKFIFVSATCFIAWKISLLIPAMPFILDFILKCCVAVIVPVLMITIVFHNNPGYKFIKDLVFRKILKRG